MRSNQTAQQPIPSTTKIRVRVSMSPEIPRGRRPQTKEKNMTIVYATVVVAVSFLIAFRMYITRDERELRTRAEIEVRMQEAKNTERLFEAEHQKQLRQATILGEAEHEVAKTRRMQEEYKVAQVQLAQDVVKAFGSYRGERLLEAHKITIDGLLEAVARQLDGLPPNQKAIAEANDRTRLAFQEAARKAES